MLIDSVLDLTIGKPHKLLPTQQESSYATTERVSPKDYGVRVFILDITAIAIEKIRVVRLILAVGLEGYSLQSEEVTKYALANKFAGLHFNCDNKISFFFCFQENCRIK